ncbi:reverse transcriptase domain-containing protein [Artemisia annua]|uniref:Reverse transcriptase domain-containing protein n=1 Tax=Artemisia annua TaxID=35608 RepID=A0A2U1NUJ4_ARTAN|nr:reverse transcriptase domain-containing protein [Artemisia annua]
MRKDQNKLMLNAAPREPRSSHNHRPLIVWSEKAHPMKTSRETSMGIQARPDPNSIPQKAKCEIAKGRKNTGRKREVEHLQEETKLKNPEGKLLKLQRKSIPKREGSATIPSQKRCKKQRQGNPYIPKEINPFTENIRNAKLPEKTRMPDNVQPYDGNEDPVDHIRVFQTVARVYKWDAATQCRMFKRTLTGAAKVWFESVPQGSLDDFGELRDAFLETFLSMKKHKDRDKRICCARKRRNEPIEDFTRRFLAESRRAKKMPEIAKFIKKVSDLGLIEHLHREIPKSIEEVVRITRAYCRAEEAAKSLRQWR